MHLAGTVAACSACRFQIMVPLKSGDMSFIISAPTAPARGFGFKFRLRRPHVATAGAPERPDSRAIIAVMAAMILILVLAGVLLYPRLTPKTSLARSKDEPTAPGPATPSVPARKEAVKLPVEARQIDPLPANAPAPSVTDAKAALPVEAAPAAKANELPDLLSRSLLTPPKKNADEDDRPVEPAKPEAKKEDIQLAAAPAVPAENNAASPEKPPAPTVPGLIDKPAAAAVDPLRIAARTPDVCTQCMGTGFLPLLPGHSYIHLVKDPAPNPVEAVPWRYCSKCRPKDNPSQLLQQETERLKADKAKASQDKIEAASRLKFIRGETQHVTLYMQFAEPLQGPQVKPGDGKTKTWEDRTRSDLKDIAAALEELKILLERNSGTTVLTQTRPESHEMVIVRDIVSYNIALDSMMSENNVDEKLLARRASGISGRYRSFYNSYLGTPDYPRLPRHMALFLMGQMFMMEGSDSKAKPWLIEGFASYCEHAVTHKNLCYSFAYEPNDVRIGAGWDSEIRRFARDGKLKPWRQIFGLDLVLMKPVDYLCCYSIVSFLMNDPPRFARFIVELRAGADTLTALEKAYNRKVDDLQSMWANWTLR
jgi:hypothetical protein